MADFNKLYPENERNSSVLNSLTATSGSFYVSHEIEVNNAYDEACEMISRISNLNEAQIKEFVKLKDRVSFKTPVLEKFIMRSKKLDKNFLYQIIGNKLNHDLKWQVFHIGGIKKKSKKNRKTLLRLRKSKRNRKTNFI
jgi:hypothetical protein